MALIGYEAERQKIENAIAEIRSQLAPRSTGSAPVVAGAPKPRRKISAKGKAAIQAAQRKRWAEFHAKVKKPATKKVAMVRKIVKAQRKRPTKG